MDYNAKLDFGCAKDGPLDGKSHVSTRVLGTYGYAAHEYMATGKTILTNINYYYYLLVDYAKPYLTSNRRVLHIIDQCTVGQYSSEVAARAAVLAMKCLSREPKCRPTVDELVNVLEQLQELQKGWDSCRKETGRKHNGNKNVGRCLLDVVMFERE
ncbi:putative non-specific serine/threonine protein kinase [Helianthus annuus]|nr:putative non-specific serine/threonine protein kinase [Helianthus annuus]